MEDWQQRVIDEKSNLDARLEKLDAFISAGKSVDLDPMERFRISSQRYHMNAYSEVLRQRIEAFSK
jgi:uncharacterized protein